MRPFKFANLISNTVAKITHFGSTILRRYINVSLVVDIRIFKNHEYFFSEQNHMIANVFVTITSVKCFPSYY